MEKEKFNQTAYITEYRKTHYKRYRFEVKLTEEDVINKLDNVENKTAYLIGLIKQDLATKKEPTAE